jgi:hypothetical protein
MGLGPGFTGLESNGFAGLEDAGLVGLPGFLDVGLTGLGRASPLEDLPL